MSTILRALKKLEQDKEALGTRGMSRIAATIASAKGRPTGRFGSSKRLLYAAVIGAAFIGVSGAALYFYIQSKPPATQATRSSAAIRKIERPQTTTPVQHAINRFDSDSSQSRLPPQPQTKPAPQSKQPPDRLPRSELAGARMQEKPMLPKRVASRERLEQNQNLPKAVPPDAATAPAGAKGDPAGPGPAPVDPVTPTGSTTSPADPKSEDESAYANADRLMDNRLKIQAIAWSPVPDERMAVINSRILHEGDSVEGFSVVAIRSDDVIVREKGQLYRVNFGSN